MNCSSYSRGCSVRACALVADYGNEQVRDAGCPHLSDGSELLTIHGKAFCVEQQDAATECLTFMQWLERACGSELVRMHDQFDVARLDFFHAAVEYDPAAVDKHDIGENV